MSKLGGPRRGRRQRNQTALGPQAIQWGSVSSVASQAMCHVIVCETMTRMEQETRRERNQCAESAEPKEKWERWTSVFFLPEDGALC